MQITYHPLTADTEMLYAWCPAMHSRVDMVMYGKERRQLNVAAHAIRSEIETLEQVGNYFDANSELSSVNRRAGTQPVKVSDPLLQMLLLSKEYWQRTRGYFDISFRSAGHHALTMESVCIDGQSREVSFGQKGISLDLSGFLKGFALDRIKNLLCQAGIENALINAGNSSVLALGNHPYGKGWKVSLQPGVEADGTDTTLFNQCFTTSGNSPATPRHIVCPHTGQYIVGMQNISVVSPGGAEGEALSTSIFAAPSAAIRHEIATDFNSKYFIHSTKTSSTS